MNRYVFKIWAFFIIAERFGPFFKEYKSNSSGVSTLVEDNLAPGNSLQTRKSTNARIIAGTIELLHLINVL